MTTYAVGDIHGCLDALHRLLAKIDFKRSRDKLWLVGDLVNRGTDSLDTLRFLIDHDDCITAVLGNHDLHVWGRALGVRPKKRRDTVDALLDAKDVNELLTWLTHRPLFVESESHAMVHAGLWPTWSFDDARGLATIAQKALVSSDGPAILSDYGNPTFDRWHNEITGTARVQTILNIMTGMRAIGVDGRMLIDAKGSRNALPADARPWFDVPSCRTQDTVIIAGHWAALGIYVDERVMIIDSGCVWGHELTAIRLEDRKRFSVSFT
ncbi:MAG: bis(5'-nucleosyl)-tetraphosphatase (symmetrical) [Deltaproteobacteria bacterium RIFOXYA12_FULL_58_15]|nr:MAG: bis(5'-nucleosyl)-tetraphosphatase (symmetrical) [Deltaproteobacteria bacterium RIFOXYA12_FULL_58_15]